MPQIDFGKAFEDQNADTPGNSQPGAPVARASEDIFFPGEPAKFRSSRLGRADWTNIIFVIITVLGGLFCAFYFFNGAELVRGAAAWPGEFLYSRPGAADVQVASVQSPGLTEQATANDASASNSADQRIRPVADQTLANESAVQTAPADNGNLPQGGPVLPPPPPTLVQTVIGDVNAIAPVTDGLTQTLNQTTASVANTATTTTQNTVAGGQTRVSRVKQRPIAQTKKTVHRSEQRLAPRVGPYSFGGPGQGTNGYGYGGNGTQSGLNSARGAIGGIGGVGGVGGIGGGGGIGGIGGIGSPGGIALPGGLGVGGRH